MKVFVLLGALILTGCASMQSMEQLEKQAFLTGDWSAVEQRHRILAKRETQRAAKCQAGFVAYCEKQMGSERCSCVKHEQIRSLLSWQ